MYEFYGETLSAAGKIANHSVQKISWGVNTQKIPGFRLDKEDDIRIWEKGGNGAPVVVFNSLSWDWEGPVEINKTLRRVEDAEGNVPQHQHVVGCHCQEMFDKWHTVFYARIPAMGYALFWMYRGDRQPAEKSDLAGMSPHVMENAHARVEFEPHSGYVAKWFDKDNNVELLRNKGGVPLVVDEFPANNWGGTYTDVMARFSDARLELLEAGPVRWRVRATSFYGRSELRQDFILYRDGRDIEVRGRVLWNERHKMLKIAWRPDLDRPEVAHEVPYASVVKQPNGGEECGNQWFQLNGLRGGKPASMAIVNDNKYGFSAEGNDMRLTIVRSPIHSDSGPASREELAEFTDIGLHEFAYRVIPGDGPSSQAATVRKAWELNVPLTPVLETYHEGPLPSAYRGVEVSAENIVVAALKESEDGAAFVLRCHETAGRDTEADIRLPLLDRALHFKIGRHQVKTFWLPKDGKAPVEERNFLEL